MKPTTPKMTKALNEVTGDVRSSCDPVFRRPGRVGSNVSVANTFDGNTWTPRSHVLSDTGRREMAPGELVVSHDEALIARLRTPFVIGDKIVSLGLLPPRAQ